MGGALRWSITRGIPRGGEGEREERVDMCRGEGRREQWVGEDRANGGVGGGGGVR